MFILTMNRSWQNRSEFRYAGIFRVFLRDGTAYFFTICVVNLVNIAIYLMGNEDFQTIGAIFWQVATSTMVSRMVLNIRAMSLQYNISRYSYFTFDGFGTDGRTPGEREGLEGLAARYNKYETWNQDIPLVSMR